MSDRTSRRRLLAVLRLAFGGPANASVWNWWPLVVFVVSVFLGAFGTRIPKVSLSHAAWIAVGLGVISLLLLRAAYKLHADVHPDFPLHRVSFSSPIYITKEHRIDSFLFFDMSYTNRTDKPVNLVIELYWEWDKNVPAEKRLESRGPHRCSTINNSPGSDVFAQQPVRVGPHDTTAPETTLAFSMATAWGVSEGEHLTAVLKPGVKMFVRLSDLVSDSVVDEPLPVDLMSTLAPTKREP